MKRSELQAILVGSVFPVGVLLIFQNTHSETSDYRSRNGERKL